MKRIGVIAGATGGVGKILSEKLAKKGDTLVLIAKDMSKLERIKNEIQMKIKNTNIFTDAVDFEESDEEKVKHIFLKYYDKFGKIDYLINCIGFCSWYPVEDMPLKIWDKVISINLKSTFLLSKYAVLYMKKQKSGTIINISSVAGKKGAPYSSAYCASKFGIIGFSKSLTEEVSKDGIKVIVVIPSTIMTDFVKKGVLLSPDPLKKYVEEKYINKPGITPSNFANLVVSLLDLSNEIPIKEVIV
jgi:3-oxoacyl-[acyl-carrier protein] reductase